MPKQKDLKRLVRTRMEKTGEAYTAARLHLVRPAPRIDFASAAGMTDSAVEKGSGRAWTQWVRELDRAGAAEKPHREIVAHVSSAGVPDWWAQMVTVGYERIRGLRAKGQRRGGAYEAGKSRTFNVPLETLFDAFAKARTRAKWLPVKITVKSSAANKRMRLTWVDGTPVQIGFYAKGDTKSSVAIQHEKLADKATADAMKKLWSDHLDRLGELLG